MAKQQKDALQALLGADLNVEAEVFIKRLGVNFTVKAIDGDTIDKLSDQATHYIGKGNNRKRQLNESELGRLIIAEACVTPDFNDSELKKKYGASDKSDCVQKALLAGEIAKISGTVMEISGFVEDEVDEVKN